MNPKQKRLSERNEIKDIPMNVHTQMHSANTKARKIMLAHDVMASATRKGLVPMSTIFIELMLAKLSFKKSKVDCVHPGHDRQNAHKFK